MERLTKTDCVYQADRRFKICHPRSVDFHRTQGKHCGALLAPGTAGWPACPLLWGGCGQGPDDVPGSRLGELYIGDISAASNPDEAEKHAAEERDVRRVLSLLPKEQEEEFLALWQEYNENNTDTAKLVKALDKSETILQHNQGKNPLTLITSLT